MPDEYADSEFPEMEDLPAEWEEIPDESMEAFEDEVVDPQGGEDEVPGEFEEQADLGELIEASPDAQDVSPVLPEYSPEEAPEALSEDSGGALFSPGDDPLRQPLIPSQLDPRLVYRRAVPKRLRHLTCERKGPEYNRPSGLYRPGS